MNRREIEAEIIRALLPFLPSSNDIVTLPLEKEPLGRLEPAAASALLASHPSFAEGLTRTVAGWLSSMRDMFPVVPVADAGVPATASTSLRAVRQCRPQPDLPVRVELEWGPAFIHAAVSGAEGDAVVLAFEDEDDVPLAALRFGPGFPSAQRLGGDSLQFDPWATKWHIRLIALSIGLTL